MLLVCCDCLCYFDLPRLFVIDSLFGLYQVWLYSVGVCECSNLTNPMLKANRSVEGHQFKLYCFGGKQLFSM